MQTHEPSLIARSDTLLGVCEAIGTDLGFNPTWLRAAFASMVFFNLALAVGIYLVAGAIVALSRWVFPSPRKLMAVQQALPAEGPRRAMAGMSRMRSCSPLEARAFLGGSTGSAG